jgi:stearoyl-CoA desaturase (Delta-9 desaturase)
VVRPHVEDRVSASFSIALWLTASLCPSPVPQIVSPTQSRSCSMFGIVREAWEAFVYHYKEGNMNWPMVIYLALVHLAATIGFFTVVECKWQTLLEAFILWPITGLGITAGVHRLWAHRSYNASFGYRVLLMLMNSCANQGSIFHWSRDHRAHHKYSETDADPHNATRGFFFAHMGWLLVKKHPRSVP